MTSVLIIDDCQDFRDSVFDILEDAGYKVCVADGPESAEKNFSNNEFDLVLCDLVMPVGDDEYQDHENHNSSAMVGVHTIREFAKNHPGIPIVAVSGELTGAPLAAIQNFGAVRCLSKPFGREDLLEAVGSALGK